MTHPTPPPQQGNGVLRHNILARTNALVCAIILIGFLLTAVLSYHANYNASVQSIEQVSSLTSESIYYQLMAVFTKPVNISLTMANDSLLKSYLSEEPAQLEDPGYTQTIWQYLNAYREKYGYDSVFLVSSASLRYYNFEGLDRVLTPDNPENAWYYSLLDSSEDSRLVVDNDEVAGAHNDITIFVNCKIHGKNGEILGVVGVGLRIDNLQSLLQSYQQQFEVNAFLVDDDGIIELSAEHTGYQAVSLFDSYSFSDDVCNSLLGWKEQDEAKSLWVPGNSSGGKDYVVTRYIPELSWHLIVERDTSALLAHLQRQLYVTVAIIVLIALLILLIITTVIRGFNHRIHELTSNQQQMFRKATEQLYDNIYELDLTHNRAASESTERYFVSLGVPPNTPFDQALHVIADKQIKEEFRTGYFNTFCPEHALQEYFNGNDHLRYDFMITEDGHDYFWMRIDAHIFYWADDNSVHMFAYRKNIDAEKKRELLMAKRAQADPLTGLLNRTAMQGRTEYMLAEAPEAIHAFFILDIDNFKQVNDRFGHAFGDRVIQEFAQTISRHFRSNDIIGRIGGDEFAVFVRLNDAQSAEVKAHELVRALHHPYSDSAGVWTLSASVGVALAPQDGTTFEALYEHADGALYESKKRGKNSYTLYHS